MFNIAPGNITEIVELGNITVKYEQQYSAGKYYGNIRAAILRREIFRKYTSWEILRKYTSSNIAPENITEIYELGNITEIYEQQYSAGKYYGNIRAAI